MYSVDVLAARRALDLKRDVQVLEKGFGIIRKALDEDTVAGFVKQIQECITDATQPEQVRKARIRSGRCTWAASTVSCAR